MLKSRLSSTRVAYTSIRCDDAMLYLKPALLVDELLFLLGQKHDVLSRPMNESLYNGQAEVLLCGSSGGSHWRYL